MKRDGRTLILTNHRSQADFFVHNVLTDYKCNFLSRYRSQYVEWLLEWCSLFSEYLPTTLFGFSIVQVISTPKSKL